MVIGLERNTQANNLDARFQTKVRILKDRLYGNTGVCSIIDGRSGVLQETQSFMLNQFEDETKRRILRVPLLRKIFKEAKSCYFGCL